MKIKSLLLIIVSIIALCAILSCTHQGKDSSAASAPQASGQDSILAPKFSTPVTVEEVRAAYYAYSLPSLVKALREGDAANWDMIMDNVSAGDADWIFATAVYILPGTDAGATTDVIVSLAYGLPNNPEAVLLLETSAHISMLPICNMPFIEPEYEFIMEYGKKTLAALRKVEKPYLIESRDTCMRRLQEGMSYAQKEHAAGRWNE